jgi:ketosteroid isomerase-like protein
MTQDAYEREANVALARQIMENFTVNMEGWYDHLHDDVVMEFPFGPSVGFPKRVEGKAACRAVFAAVVANIKVRFKDIVIHRMADPKTLIVEYNGYTEPGSTQYDQTYICVQRYRDGKMTLFREYWDSLLVDRIFGNIGNLG